MIDDLQLGHMFYNPQGLWIWPRPPLPCVRVSHEALSVVDDVPQIKLVVQNAITPFFVAIDGRGIPRTPARACNAFFIEISRNLARCFASNIVFEDTPDNACFVLDNLTGTVRLNRLA